MVIVVAVVATPFISAHNYLPQTPGQTVTQIPNIDISRAAYRELAGGGVDVYEFSARKGQQIYVQMTVPFLDREKDFAPDFALVYMGEELAQFADPALEKGSVVDPAHEVVDAISPPAGKGDHAEPPALAVRYDRGGPVVFNEPFTGTRYWIRQTVTVNAPAQGVYRLAVYSQTGAPGKYVLATGKKESFGAADIIRIPGVRIAVRRFCEVPVWPDYAVWGTLGAAALAGIGFGIYTLLRGGRRRRRAHGERALLASTGQR